MFGQPKRQHLWHVHGRLRQINYCFRHVERMKIKIAFGNCQYEQTRIFSQLFGASFWHPFFSDTTPNVNLSSWLNNSQLPWFWKGSFYTLPQRQVNFTVTYRDSTKMSAGQTVRTAVQERYCWTRVISRGHHHCTLEKVYVSAIPIYSACTWLEHNDIKPALGTAMTCYNWRFRQKTLLRSWQEICKCHILGIMQS